MNNPYMELMAELSGPGEDWREQAVCAAIDGDQFFTESHNATENRQKIREAKAICRTCPVQLQCLDFAISTRQQYGIWGGRNMDGRAKWATRTHCKNGHEFTPENTVMDVNGRGGEFRRCLACSRVHNARSEANRKVKPKALPSYSQGALGERRDRVAQLTRQGMSTVEIARRLNVDERTVQRDRQVMA